ncbi:MAG: hypothetical protein M3133_11020, partial [Actinomycetota bacterium]|nr:hypothetical protein [Actinomycetota bacterium]
MTEPTGAERHSRPRAAILVAVLLALLQVAWVIPSFDVPDELDGIGPAGGAGAAPDATVIEQSVSRAEGAFASPEAPIPAAPPVRTPPASPE